VIFGLLVPILVQLTRWGAPLMAQGQRDDEFGRAWVEVEPELFAFIAECLKYSRQSKGAFDITVGPLMKAWGFFQDRFGSIKRSRSF
jgi:hypothetical protein